jgi:3-hydroxybutyryl-CoA dehydratase
MSQRTELTSMPAVGATFVSRGRTITESDVVSFSALTGDWHPQHSDATWAAGSRFGERIAHGLMVVAYAIGLAGFDPERVVALRGLERVTFKRPVRIGDTIKVRGKVAEVRPLDGETALVGLDWTIQNQDRATVVRARVDVLWRSPGERQTEQAGNGRVFDEVFL